MRCNDAAEFVSALCDGETIPPKAAEHIGHCSTCRVRLQGYLELGAELRRVSSLEPLSEVTSRRWMNDRQTPGWWTKGRESMRIPRFAFALLLLVIVALGSSLVLVRAKARTAGAVLMLNVKPPHGVPIRCALSLVDKKWGMCAQLNPPQYLLGIEVLSHTEDQVELGVREQFNPAPLGAGSHRASIEDLQKIPQKSYWFHPGEKLAIDVSGAGQLELTGGLTDHMPPLVNWAAEDLQIDPGPGEMRIISPILLRGDKVLFDFEGASSVQKDRHVVQMYSPGQGLWVLSPCPLVGAVEAEVALSRVKFKLNGEPHTFVMATPVTREQHLWVLHDPHYKPSDPNLDRPFLGVADPERLANSPQNR
jgi:hypothetical protein